MRISDWSSDVCSSDLLDDPQRLRHQQIQVCRHADGNEEQAEQQTFERLDIGMEFMAKLGFGQQYTREKRTERHRQSNRGHRQRGADHDQQRSEEHTSELQSLMRSSYAAFCLQK